MSEAHITVDLQKLQSILAGHLPVYAIKTPHYQALMLESLLEIWRGQPARLLDIGGGTGVIAQAISQLFPVGSVEAIDLVDRFCPTLTVTTRQYDGRSIPCADGAFEAATLNNVLHHVPPAERGNLMREIRRAVTGPVYIKDHLTTGIMDNLRLTVLDAWGNIAFGGMVEAKYLSSTEWNELAAETGYHIGAVAHPMDYRTGIAALAFPNRLETTMRFDPA
ncbi:class I SAM-dependent methyltransferase [Sphingopyxis granuli]|uniref:class I SAM-dependent methyltransferase n=1 Tax=Sphingopyxis granuli TaxID=267128 RepID=UPI001F53848E|nr:class I SAM-dependent methyltransferase [Sphingopyxis granuli]UNK80921.1 class I SAM-dependent methyltransferase [Sphingopyxis granuli]